jgi:cellulose synthase/poly-beta-1,6-N-acetylglucosamine synthase-like glycosyltransferase
MTLVFWLAFALVAFVYVGYPLLLHLAARLAARGSTLEARDPGPGLPSVSFVIAARNEGRRIEGRLANIEELDYPADKKQIVLVSDGSTDNTGEIFARLRAGGRAIAIELREGGKARALNCGVAFATGDVIIFADMRQGFAPDALRALVAPFADPRVGAVSGELVLNGESRDRRSDEERRLLEDRRNVDDRRAAIRAESLGQRKAARRWAIRRAVLDSTIAEGVGLYWQYEKQIRRDESAAGSVVGATGAIYAMRRSLWTPLPPDTILDDVLTPMRVVMAGYRVVFEERACAFDRTASDSNAEGRRKLRTLAGNYQLLWLEPRLLLPWRNPAWLQFMSHKVGRLLVPYALPLLLILSFLLAQHSPFYAALFAAQGAFYLLATYGAWLEHAKNTAVPAGRPGGAGPVNRLARVALMFIVMNKSAVAGLVAVMTRQKVWR